MPSLAKRSFRLAGHATSVALEPEFWQALEAVAVRQGKSVGQLVQETDQLRQDRNLASALRVLVLTSLK